MKPGPCPSGSGHFQKAIPTALNKLEHQLAGHWSLVPRWRREDEKDLPKEGRNSLGQTNRRWYCLIEGILQRNANAMTFEQPCSLVWKLELFAAAFLFVGPSPVGWSPSLLGWRPKVHEGWQQSCTDGY